MSVCVFGKGRKRCILRGQREINRERGLGQDCKLGLKKKRRMGGGRTGYDARKRERMLLTYRCFPWVSNKSSRSSLFVEKKKLHEG